MCKYFSMEFIFYMKNLYFIVFHNVSVFFVV